MGFKQVNLDNPEEARQYKREKEHKRFLMDNKTKTEEELTSSFVNPEPVEDYGKELGENLIGKVVKVDKLRVRKYPEGEIIRILLKGEEVRIIEDFDDIWYKVELRDGVRGYCMKTYLMTFLDERDLDDKSRRCKTNV